MTDARAESPQIGPDYCSFLLRLDTSEVRAAAGESLALSLTGMESPVHT